jgi:hypothetical protein
MNSGYFYAPYVPLEDPKPPPNFRLERIREQWCEAGLTTMLVLAPREAVTFDKMLIVFSDENLKVIRQVSFYNSKEDKFIGTW